MRHRVRALQSPRLAALASVVALAGLLVSGGCDRTPLTPGSQPHIAPPRAVTWGAERSAYDQSLPVECSSQNPAWWWTWTNQCGGINTAIPLPAGSGAREIRVRVSGTVELEGSCGAQPTGQPFGPLGVPYFFAPGFSGPQYELYSLMMTFAYLDDGFNIRRIQLRPVGGDSTVVEGVITSDWPGRGIVVERGQPIREPSGCVPVGGLRIEVYVRDEAQQTPTLALRCDGRANADTVVRGNQMKCETSTEPAGGTVAGTAWEFQDDQGHTITGPAGDSTWSGIMVVGGKVKLSGTVNGQPQSPVELAVTVTPRDWTGKIVFPPEPRADTVAGPPLKYPPTVAGDTLADGTLGLTTYPSPEAASGFGEGSGPNAGWYFFDQVPYFSPGSSQIFINRALDPKDPFFQAQQGPSGSGHIHMEQPMCGQDFMREAARHVPVHEHGHYSRAKDFAESARGASLLESAAIFGQDPSADSVANATMIHPFVAADSVIQANWDRSSVLRVSCQLTVPAH